MHLLVSACERVMCACDSGPSRCLDINHLFDCQVLSDIMEHKAFAVLKENWTQISNAC